MKSIFKATKSVLESPLFNFNNHNLLKTLSKYEPREALMRYKGGGYLRLNSYLREDNGLPENMIRLALGVDEGLKQLPVYTGDVFRTVAFSNNTQFENFINEWKQGNTVIAKAYTSTSKGDIYNDLSNVNYGAIMKIHSLNGRDMMGIGLDESEVLFPRDTKFKVNQTQRSGNILFLSADEVQ